MLWQWANNRLDLWRLVLSWLYALGAGALIGFALPPKLFSGLEWIALAPFFLLLLFPVRGLGNLFFLGWLSGAAAFAVYLDWFFDAAPLTWIGIAGYAPGIALAALGLSLPVIYFALFWGLFLVLVKKFSKNTVQTVILVIVLWPLFEYLRVLGYSLHPMAQGAGHIFGDHFGALLLGYALAEYDSWRQLAGILGHYGMSIAVVIPNVLIFGVVSRLRESRQNSKIQTRTVLTFSIIAGIFGGLFLAGKSLANAYNQNGKEISVAVIQLASQPEDWAGNPERHRLTARETAEKLFAQVQKSSPDIIVNPEGAPTIFSDNPKSSSLSVEKIQQKLNGKYQLVVDADAFLPQGGRRDRNTTALLDPSGIVGVYEKRFIMPWGEYLPYSFIWGARAAGASNWLETQLPLKSLTPGEGPSVFETELGRVGLRTCSEILSPNLIRGTVRDGAEIIILSSSDGILRGSERLAAQNLAMGQIHAALAKTPLVYSSNSGRSFVLDHKGRILWKSDTIGEDAAVVRVFMPEGVK